uniref:Uncharacterized protein n=1 Tax=Acrobeloides nanus TaxID=290746 RepID=A0A914CDV2_9BILA
MALLYNFMTKKTSITENGLQFSNENLQKYQQATHFLTDIEYGFTAVLIVKRFLKPNESKDETKIMLQKLLDDIENSIKAKENHLKTDQVDCVFELLPIPGIDNRPKTLQDAVDTLIQLNPQSFVDIPFRYTFIPITPYFKKAQVYNKYPEDVNKSIIQAFEKFRKYQESKIAYYKNGMLKIEDLLTHCQLQKQNQLCWAKMDSNGTLFESQSTYKVPLQLICPNAVNGLCGKELHECSTITPCYFLLLDILFICC